MIHVADIFQFHGIRRIIQTLPLFFVRKPEQGRDFFFCQFFFMQKGFKLHMSSLLCHDRQYGHCSGKEAALSRQRQLLYQLSVTGFEDFGILTAAFGCHKAHEFLLQRQKILTILY